MSGTSEQKPVGASKPRRGRKYRYIPKSNRRSVGLVYFIQVGAKGPIKIGRVAGNYKPEVEGRLNTLQTAHYETLHLLNTLPGAIYEGVLHAHFGASRIRGEWFEPTPELLEFVRDPDVERILPADFKRSPGEPTRNPAYLAGWACDNCLERLNFDERQADGMLCGLCRCKFEDLELEPEAYEEISEAA